MLNANMGLSFHKTKSSEYKFNLDNCAVFLIYDS